MEDQRIGGIYLAMVKQWFSTLSLRLWRKGLMRSGMVTGLVLALLVVGLSIAYRERGRGNLHKLKAKIATEHPDVPVPRPGGQEAIVLTRSRLMGDSMPEFVSVTLLPGRGMNVLQITAYVPGRGEVSLMASPSLEDAANALTGTGTDAYGQASLTLGGAFEAPWAGSIWGATGWRGRTISPPANTAGGEVAQGGLMLAQAAYSSDTYPLPDGGHAMAVYRAGDFGAHWPSKTEVTVTALLSSRAIELTVVAHNTGDTPEPVGIGWRPRFAILGGDRDQLRLRIPGQMRAEVRDRASGQPTGVLLPVAGTPYDFTRSGGAKLGSMSLDDCFVSLHQDLLDNGPVAELSDSGIGYGLRLTAMSPAIKAMHVLAPANADFVSIAPQFNYDDPLGREWAKQSDTGMVVLQPGQSTEWKVRLELFSPDASGPPL